MDQKEKLAFDFRVTAESVYEQYCLDNGNHYSFEVFKSETMQLGTGIHLSRRRSGKNNDSCYYNVMPIDLLICNEKSKTQVLKLKVPSVTGGNQITRFWIEKKNQHLLIKLQPSLFMTNIA